MTRRKRGKITRRHSGVTLFNLLSMQPCHTICSTPWEKRIREAYIAFMSADATGVSDSQYADRHQIGFW